MQHPPMFGKRLFSDCIVNCLIHHVCHNRNKAIEKNNSFQDEMGCKVLVVKGSLAEGPNSGISSHPCPWGHIWWPLSAISISADLDIPMSICGGFQLRINWTSGRMELGGQGDPLNMPTMITIWYKIYLYAGGSGLNNHWKWVVLVYWDIMVMLFKWVTEQKIINAKGWLL